MYLKPVFHKNTYLHLLALALIMASCAKDSGLTENATELQKEAITFRASKYNFTASLKGDNEVPAVETHAAGNIIVKIAKDESYINYKLIVANIEDVLFSHFHVAPAGQNGAVVAFLYPGPVVSNPDGILAEGVITADDVVGPMAGDLAALITAIRNGGIYTNVHTAINRGGELRGQL